MGRHIRNRQAGQTTTIVALALGLFLLGVTGLAVDVTNWVFHRQMAQGAADAACTAGVMDLVASASAGGASYGKFPANSPPNSFFCSASSTTAACQYAAFNGYNAGGLVANQASNDVKITFPSSAPGLSVCSATNPPPCIPPAATAPYPYILANVFDRVPTTFTGILTGKRTTDVAASAVCAVINATAPVPIIVMNPSCPHAFELSGTSTVKIVGGPTRSVEVNSSDTTCAAATNNAASQCFGNPTIDLSQGGPNYTGSEFAVVGQPKTAPTNFIPGSTGGWSGGGPISDPYAMVSAPTVPSASPTDGAPIMVTYPTDGCPDQTAKCAEYKPGLYTHYIKVDHVTAIFVPGIYYMQSSVTNQTKSSPGSGCVAGPTGQGNYVVDVSTNGIVRPSTATGDGSKGVMFYLSGTGSPVQYGSVFFGSDSGSSPHNVDDFVTSNATCDGTSPPAKLGIPTHLPGNILLGQCTSAGTYFGPGSTDTSGLIRGLIFFQNRANGDPQGQPSMHGGGGLILSGNMYFHNCNASGTGTGCVLPPNGYKAFFNLQGSPGNTSYVLGNITTDELVMGGTGTIAMSLNPNAVYNILKASLIE